MNVTSAALTYFKLDWRRQQFSHLVLRQTTPQCMQNPDFISQNQKIMLVIKKIVFSKSNCTWRDLVFYSYFVVTWLSNLYRCKSYTQLLIISIDAQAFSNAAFGQGTGPIYLTGVACGSTQNRLIDCPHNVDTSRDSHARDAGVRCSETCKSLHPPPSPLLVKLLCFYTQFQGQLFHRWYEPLQTSF